MGFLKVLYNLNLSTMKYIKTLHTIKTKQFINITFATEKIIVRKWKQRGKFLNAF